MPDGGDPLQDEGVEAVEGARGRELDVAALGRVRVHVVEVLKAGTVLEVAVDREPVGDADPRRPGGRRGRRGSGQHHQDDGNAREA